MRTLEFTGILSIWVAALTLWGAGALLRPVSASNELSQSLLRFTTLILVAIGTLGICLVTFGPLSIVSWPVAMLVWWRLAAHQRQMLRRELFSALALAASERMPLGSMAMAFADEQQGTMATRIRRFARRMDQGSELEAAIRKSPRLLPREALLAADVGRQTGDLGAALRAVSAQSTLDRTMLRPVIMRLLHVLLIVLALFWFEVSVRPSLTRILQDFRFPIRDLGAMAGSELTGGSSTNPADTAALVGNLFEYFSSGWGAASMIIVSASIGFILLAIVILAWLQWRGTLFIRLPFWSRIVDWVDSAGVVRIAALGIDRQCPLNNLFMAIARYHPKHSVRYRAWRVVRSLNDGEQWQQGMLRQGLLSKADAAVAVAAERNGTLPPALVEMAGSFERRATHRLQVLAQFILPILLIPLGIVTASILIAYFAPLPMLIKWLA